MSAAAELSSLAAALVLLATAVFNAPAPQIDPASLRTTDSGSYRVLSDAGDDEVRHVIQTLTDLHTQFRQEFATLLDSSRNPGKIEVIFFNHEADYRAYTQRVAPALTGSAGCYVSTEDRLAILNQASSTEFTRARQQIEVRQQRLAGWTDAPQRLQAAARLTEWRDAVVSEARASTDRLIRHEGAHQLFHAYAIESKFPVEPTWLTEGLAEYCETSTIGAPHESLAKSLRRARDAGALIPLTMLLNHRDPAGFFALGEDQRDIAYAESWAFVSLLMQCHREQLFDLIAHYRSIQTAAAGNDALSEDTGFAALESEWQAFLNVL